MLVATPKSVPTYNLQLLTPLWVTLDKLTKQEMQKQSVAVTRMTAVSLQFFAAVEDYTCARGLPDQFP